MKIWVLITATFFFLIIIICHLGFASYHHTVIAVIVVHMFVGREGPEADQEGKALMVVTLQREYGLMHQGAAVY